MNAPRIVLSCSTIEAMMHGVSHFILEASKLTAVYTDGQRETAPAGKHAQDIEAYFRYQNENGPEASAPNTFSLVSAIQAARQS